MTSAIESDSHFIAESLPIFVGEAREQIETIEQLLLRLEDEPANHELLDALFRCAHTVKGSAGIFGLDRGGGLHPPRRNPARPPARRPGEPSQPATSARLLLQCNDEIRALISRRWRGRPRRRAMPGAGERQRLVAAVAGRRPGRPCRPR